MFLVLFFLKIPLLSACTHHNQAIQISPSSGSIRKDGTLDFVSPDKSITASIAIEIADTPETLMKGLMGRSMLDDNSGMLFVFERLEPQKFWMKNTPISLDIIFLGENRCVINISESTKPMSEERYRSDGPIKYVVEVPAGFVKRYKLGKDTCTRWQRR